MAGDTSTPENSFPSLPFSTLIHMITVKLSSTNFLLWRSQVLPLFTCQSLLGHIDGSLSSPSPTVTGANNIPAPNPAFHDWFMQDQRLVSLLRSSLSEEALSVVVECNTAREIWVSLERTYSHDSKDREFSIRETLLSFKKGSLSIQEYGQKFKTMCDQLAAIGRPIDETDKAHWFLRGLGTEFSSFSAAQMALTPIPSFRDLLPRAEGFAMFQTSLAANSSIHPTAAFTAQSQRHSSSHHGRGGYIHNGSYHNTNNGGYNKTGSYNNNSGGRGGRNGGRGGNRGGGRGGGRGSRPYTPRCQLCDTDGHTARACTDPKYARTPHHDSANLAILIHKYVAPASSFLKIMKVTPIVRI